MKLTQRILFTTGVMLFALSVILFALARGIFIRGFSELEERKTRENMKQVLHTLNDRLIAMKQLDRDWAIWDATYNYIQSPSGNRAPKDLTITTMQIIRVNLMAALNVRNEVVFHKILDNEREHEIHIPHEELRRISAMLLRHPDKGYPGSKGVVILNGKPILAASYPIHKSNGEGQPRGFFLLGRAFDDSVLDRLEETTGLELEVLPARGEDATPATQDVITMMRYNRDNVAATEISEKTITGYALVTDPDGNPILLLKNKQSRAIYMQGRKSVSYLLAAMIAISFVFLGFALLYFQKVILRNVSLLINDIVHLELTDDHSTRLPENRSDELGQIAASTNRLLDAREKARLELVQSEARYRTFVANFSGIIFQMDMGFRPVMIMGNIEEITGYTEQELLEKTIRWNDIVHPEDTEAILTTAKRLTQAPCTVLEIEHRIITKDKSIRWIRAVVQNNSDESGAPVSVQGAVFDITERKQTEKFLESSEKYSAIAQISMGLSHEIKNPLTIMQTHIETLIENDKVQDLNDDNVDYSLGVLIEQCDRIGAILSSLSSLARETPFRPETLDLRKQTRALMEMFAPKMKNSGITYVEKIASPGEIMIDIDEGRLVKILANLTLNAMESMNKGGTLWLEIRDIPESESVEIQIADTGRGIEPHNLARVFEPFFTTSPRGTGMGLALCKRFVEDHGGDISIRSAPGAGACVTIRLPKKHRAGATA